jgi:hypothetical protein
VWPDRVLWGAGRAASWAAHTLAPGWSATGRLPCQQVVKAARRGRPEELFEILFAPKRDCSPDHVVERGAPLGLQATPGPVGDASPAGSLCLRPSKGDPAVPQPASQLKQDLGRGFYHRPNVAI